MRFLLAAILLASALAAPSLSAHTGPFDPAFGEGGLAAYAFQPVAGNQADEASVGCAGPNGSFVVSGAASSGRRFVTVRLRPDGSYDTGFSGDGKESFDLVTDPGSYAPAVCQPNGDPVMVRIVTAAGGEQHMRVVRIKRDTGLPDAGFGNGGVVDLDLDLHMAGLGQAEVPMGLNVLGNGDLVISGYASLAGTGISGFVALLDASGAVRTAQLVQCWQVATTLENPAGSLWTFGSTGNGACRITLDRDTLAPGLRVTQDIGSTVRPGAARAVRGGTVAMAAAVAAPGGYHRPMLMVFRGDAVTPLALPAPVLQGTALGMSDAVGVQGVQILPGGRVLYAGTSRDLASGFDDGLYFAMMRIGRESGDDQLESAFGNGGMQVGRFQPDTPACNAAAPRQLLYRVTAWLGRPAFVGKVNTNCLDGSGENYLVGRVETDYLFADGMD